MNIFILSESPAEAAQYHCDAHVVKMILESTQLLCNCFPENSFKEQYKRTHYNHPCSKWARESIDNYNWLYDFTFHLIQEYNHRYKRWHACHSVFRKLPQFNHECKEMTPFALAMPESFHVFNSDSGEINHVNSYRNYYKHKRETMKLFRYTNRSVPSFLSSSS